MAGRLRPGAEVARRSHEARLRNGASIPGSPRPAPSGGYWAKRFAQPARACRFHAQRAFDPGPRSLREIAGGLPPPWSPDCLAEKNARLLASTADRPARRRTAEPRAIRSAIGRPFPGVPTGPRLSANRNRPRCAQFLRREPGRETADRKALAATPRPARRTGDGLEREVRVFTGAHLSPPAVDVDKQATVPFDHVAHRNRRGGEGGGNQRIDARARGLQLLRDLAGPGRELVVTQSGKPMPRDEKRIARFRRFRQICLPVANEGGNQVARREHLVEAFLGVLLQFQLGEQIVRHAPAGPLGRFGPALLHRFLELRCRR